MAQETMRTPETVVGYFASEPPAEEALRTLREAGFRNDQISVAGRPESSGITATGAAPATMAGGPAATIPTEDTERKQGFWGRLFSGESKEGPETSMESAAPETFEFEPGRFSESLVNLSVPEERARYFGRRFERDSQGVLVVVQSGPRSAEAEGILESCGADVGRDLAAPAPVQSGATRLSERQRIQLYGEVVRVHRERVGRGEARLRKETVTETQRVEVPVTREELVVERSPVAGEKPAPGARIGEPSEIRIPLSEEHVSVEKEPVLREEVEVGKKEIRGVESRDEKLRREELRVENERRPTSSGNVEEIPGERRKVG